MPPQPARRRLPPPKPLPASSNSPSDPQPAAAPVAARADPPSQPSVLRSRFVVAEEDPEEEEGLEEEPEEEPMEEPDEEEPEEGVEEDYEEEGGEEMEEEQEVEEEEEEEEEIPEPIREKRRNREFEVFVGGLPRDAAEEDLERAFMGVGEVVEVRLVMRPNSNENKGFAFLRFATVEQARAAADLEYVKVMGKSCGVIRSNDNETLHVANICTGWTKADLVENLKAFKLENLEEVHLIDDAYIKGKNRGFAFLDFSTHMDAVAACSKLQKREIFLGTDVRAEVSFANSSGPDEEYMSQVKSVFLDNLPTSWDEAKVVEHLEMFGEIERVQLARNMLTAKRKDFGFVYFTTRQAALDCIEKVNKDGVGKGDKKVMLKATLKRPMQKRPSRMLVDRRGYIGKGFGSRRPQVYGFDRSFSNRRTRSREYMDREFSDRPGGPSRFSPRGFGFKRTRSSPPGKYVDQSRREYVRKIPGTAVLGSRSRDPYLKNCSSGGHAPGTLQYFSATKYHLREPYAAADIYEPEYEHCEDYDCPASPEYRQSYSEVDYDMVPISMTRRVRTRPNMEMARYPQCGGPVYDEYSRDLPEDYDRGEDTRRVYKSRYTSRGGASRYYYRTPR